MLIELFGIELGGIVPLGELHLRANPLINLRHADSQLCLLPLPIVVVFLNSPDGPGQVIIKVIKAFFLRPASPYGRQNLKRL